MNSHLRANFWLISVSLVACCGFYPAALWLVGKAAFSSQAEGSLLRDDKGRILGSSLIAHEYKGDEWFQLRPSAVNWNAAGSGGSNWGANNYLLRDRACRILGPIVKYQSGPKKGQLAADDIVAWFRADRHGENDLGIVAQWAKDHPGVAQAWVKSDDAAKDFVKDWFRSHASSLEAWKKENPDAADPSPEDLAVPFFVGFSKEYPGNWLTIRESKEKNDKGDPIKIVDRINVDATDPGDIASVFFDAWRTAHPEVELQRVPADMVTASGSGLDPHITLDNARYQLDRVASAWAEKTNRDKASVRADIDRQLAEFAFEPLHGLGGTKLIDVAKMNVAIQTAFRR